MLKICTKKIINFFSFIVIIDSHIGLTYIMHRYAFLFWTNFSAQHLLINFNYFSLNIIRYLISFTFVIRATSYRTFFLSPQRQKYLRVRFGPLTDRVCPPLPILRLEKWLSNKYSNVQLSHRAGTTNFIVFPEPRLLIAITSLL